MQIKKIKYLILTLLLVFPIFADAIEEESLENNAEKKEIVATNILEGVEKASPGEVITYELKVKSDVAIKEYNATLTYENTVLELISVENSGSFKGNNSITKSPVELTFKHDSGVVGESSVCKLSFRVLTTGKSDSIITLDGRVITFDDGTINNIEKYSKNLSVKSTDNTLKSLKINGHDVVNFKPNQYSYTQEVDSSVVYANIDAELNSSSATFKEGYGSRSVPLEYGENVIEIKVIADSSDEKTYVLTLVKPDNRGTDNSLKNIFLNSGKIKLDFDSKTLLYHIKTYKLETINVEAVAMDSKANIKIEKDEKLKTGENIINIVVTSESGSDKTYKIVIDNVDYNVDTSLKNISIIALGGEIDFDFSKDVFDYDIVYKSRYKDSIVVIPDLSNDTEAKLDQELFDRTSKNIVSGSKVEIRIYGADGSESTYILNFVKDERINFFFILFFVLIIVLSIVLYRLYKNKKNDKMQKNNDKNLEKTKEIVKIGA